jgi:hypothetical protein
MEAPDPRRTLIVANRTANTLELLAEIRRRARERPTTFALLVPDIRSRTDDDWSLERATALIERETGTRVEGIAGGRDPFRAVRQAVEHGAFDDVLISTLPQPTSEWLRRDLPRRVQRLGIPVTVVTARRGPAVGVGRQAGLNNLGMGGGGGA